MDPIDWDLITKKLESLNESLNVVELSEEDLDVFPSLTLLWIIALMLIVAAVLLVAGIVG
jgi:hypothetical protein